MPDQLRLDVNIAGADTGAVALGRVVNIADSAAEAFLRLAQVSQVAMNSYQAQATAASQAAGAMATVTSGASGAAGALANATNATNANTQATNAAHSAYISLGSALTALPGPLGSYASALGLVHVRTTQTAAATIGLGSLFLTAGAGIAEGLGHAVGEAAQFQRTFAELQVVTQANAQQMEEMRVKALQLGAATTFNSQEVAAGMRELAQAGLTTTQVMAAIEPATQAAMLGATNLDQATRMIANTMRQFGMGASDVTHIVDVMTVAAQGSTIRFGEFGQLIANLRGRTQELGLSFEEVVASEMAMTNAGIPASAASTALGTAIDRIAKNTGEARAGMRELNVQAFDANGKFVGWFEVLKQIERTLPNLTQQQQVHALSLLAGSRAAGAFQQVLQQEQAVMVNGHEEVLKGTALLEHYRGALEGSAGAAQNAANVIGNTAVVQWQRFNASVQEANIQVGTGFLQTIQGIMPPLTNFINAFITAPASIHQTTAAILAIGAATATLIGVTLIATTVWGAFGVALGAAAVAAAPVIISIGAIAAALALLATAWINNWGEIRTTGEAAAQSTSTWMDAEKQYIIDVLIPAWQRYWAERTKAPPPTPGEPSMLLPPNQQAVKELVETGGKPPVTSPLEEEIASPSGANAQGRALWENFITGVKEGQTEVPLGSVLFGALNPEEAAKAAEASRNAIRPLWDKVADDLREAGYKAQQNYAQGNEDAAPIVMESLDQEGHMIHDRMMDMANEGRQPGIELLNIFKSSFLAGSPELANAIDQTVTQAARQISANINGMGAETGGQYTEGIIEGALVHLRLLIPGLPPQMQQIIRQAIHDNVDIRQTGVDMTTGFVEGAEQGMAPLADRIQVYLDETAKRSKETGEITGMDYAKAFQAALAAGDPQAAQGIIEIQRAMDLYNKTLKDATPAQYVWMEQTRLSSDVQHALQAAVDAGIISQEQYTAAIEGGAAAHAKAKTAAQQHQQQIKELKESTDASQVAQGLWLEKVDQFIQKTAQATPVIAAQITALRNAGQEQQALDVIAAHEGLTREQLTARIQSETSARGANTTATHANAGAITTEAAALSQLSNQRADQVYAAMADRMKLAEHAHYDFIKSSQGVQAAIREMAQDGKLNFEDFTNAVGADAVKFKQYMDSMRAAASGITGARVQGFSDPYGQAAGKSPEQAANILGYGVSQGLAQGIAQGAPAVNQAISNLAMGSVTAAQSTFGIHSPSELFANQVGRPIAEGIAQGIEDGGHLIAEAVETQVKGAAMSADAIQIMIQERQAAQYARTMPAPVNLTQWDKTLDLGVIGLGTDKFGAEKAAQAFKALDNSLDELAGTIDKAALPVEKLKNTIDDLDESADSFGPSTPGMIEDVARMYGPTRGGLMGGAVGGMARGTMLGSSGEGPNLLEQLVGSSEEVQTAVEQVTAVARAARETATEVSTDYYSRYETRAMVEGARNAPVGQLPLQLQQQQAQASSALWEAQQRIVNLGNEIARYNQQQAAAQASYGRIPEPAPRNPYEMQQAQIALQLAGETSRQVGAVVAAANDSIQNGARTRQIMESQMAATEARIQMYYAVLDTPQGQAMRNSYGRGENPWADPAMVQGIRDAFNTLGNQRYQEQQAAREEQMIQIQQTFVEHTALVAERQAQLVNLQEERGAEINGAEREAILRGVSYIPSPAQAAATAQAEFMQSPEMQDYQANFRTTSDLMNELGANVSGVNTAMTQVDSGLTGFTDRMGGLNVTVDEVNRSMREEDTGLAYQRGRAYQAGPLTQAQIEAAAAARGELYMRPNPAGGYYASTPLLGQASYMIGPGGLSQSQQQLARNEASEREFLLQVQQGTYGTKGKVGSDDGGSDKGGAGGGTGSTSGGIAPTSGTTNALSLQTEAAKQAAEVQHAIQEAGKVAMALTTGSDLLAAQTARAYAQALQDASGDTAVAQAYAEATRSTMQQLAKQAQALQQGAMVLTQSITTAVGLTYGQIYGMTNAGGGAGANNSSPSGLQGVVNLNPGNYYGIPVVSPLTQGTLRGYASGGMIYEPSYIVPTRTGVPSGIMAERGPEPVGWNNGGGGIGNVAITVYAGRGAGDDLQDRAYWEAVVDQQLRPVLKARRLI